MRFLFDEMLKKLASWCRIFGIYSEHYTGKTDTELLEYAKSKNLIFVTRDEALSKRCAKQGVECIFIRTTDIREQIERIIDAGAEIRFPDEPRCAACNGELDKVSKEDIADELPPKVDSEKYWKCRSCGKVFWEGGHWKNIMKLFESLKNSKAI